MWRFLIYSIFLSILSISTANACSCLCTHDEYVSDYVQDRKVFWGIPLESNVEKRQHPYIEERGELDYRVTKIEILEGYGRHQNGSIILSVEHVRSSCANEFEYGKPTLMSAWGPYNKVGGCGCEPPYKALFSYLKTGQNTFLPDPYQCQREVEEHQRPASCEIWYEQWENAIDDHNVLMRERERIIALHNLGVKTDVGNPEISEADNPD